MVQRVTKGVIVPQKVPRTGHERMFQKFEGRNASYDRQRNEGLQESRSKLEGYLKDGHWIGRTRRSWTL